MTDRPGVIMSASDVEAAIEWAGENHKARWYVARMANAYGKGKLVPAEWGIEPVGTFREQRITSDEDLQRSAAIDKAVGAFADAVEDLRSGAVDQEGAEAMVASVVGWSEQSGVLDDAFRCITQGGNTYVETGYVPRETMDALLAAGGKVVRHVRTEAGARRYGAPIGTPIVRDTKTGELKADKSAPKLDAGTRPAPNPTSPVSGDKVAKDTKAVNTSAKDLEDGDEIIARDGRTHVITGVTQSGDSVKLTALDSEGKEHSYEVPGTSRVRAVRAEGERPNTDPSKVTERKNDDIEDVSREIAKLEATGKPEDKRKAIDLKAARTESKRKDTSSRIKPQPYKVPPAAPDREITRGRKSYEVGYKNKAGEPVTGQFWSLADGGRDAFVIPDGERRPIRVTVGEDGSISEAASMQATKGGRKMTDTALMDALIPNREEDSQLDLLDSEATPDAAQAPERKINPAAAPGESVKDAPQSPRAAGIAAANEAVKAAQVKYDNAFYEVNRLAYNGRSSSDEGLKARSAATKAERALAEAEVELANQEREFIGDTAWEARMRIAGTKIRRTDEELANQKAERKKNDQIDTGNRLQAAVQTARRDFQAAVQEAKSVQDSNADPVASARARVAQLEAKGRIGRAVADFQQWEYENKSVSAAQYDAKRAAWNRTNMAHQEAMLDARRELAAAEEADKGWQEPDVGGSPEIEAPATDVPEVDAPEAPEAATPDVPEEAVTPEAAPEPSAPEEVVPEAKTPEPEATATPLDPEPEKPSKPELAPLEERVDLAPDLWENVSNNSIDQDNHARFQAFTVEAERLQALSQSSESPVEAANARFQAHVFRTAARHEEDARIARLKMTGEFKGDILTHHSDKRTQDKFDREMRASLVEAARKASPDGELTSFAEPKNWYDEKNKPEEKATPERTTPKSEEPKAEPAKPAEKLAEAEKPSFEENDVVEINGENWRVYSSNEFGVLYVDRKNENGDTARKRVDASDVKMVRSVKEAREKKRTQTVAKVREHLGMADGQGAGKVEDEEVENLLKMTKARRKSLFEDPDAYSEERLDDVLVALSTLESEYSGGRAMWEVSEQKKISRALNDLRMARAERGRVAKVKEAETKKEGSTKVDGNGEALEIYGVDGKGRRTREIGERYLNSKGKLVTAQGGEEYFDLREEDMVYKLGNKGYQQWAIIKQFPNGDVQIASSDTHADRQRRLTSVTRIVHPSQLTRGDATGRQQQESENERRHRRGLVLQDANRRELDTSLEYEVTDGQSRGKRGKITSEYGDDLDSVFVEFDDGTSGHFPANMLSQVGKAKAPRKERQERIEASKAAPETKPGSETEENELDALFRDADPDEVGGELVDGELKVKDRARTLGTIDDAIEAAESNLDPKLNRGSLSADDKKLYTERVKALKAIRARVAEQPEQTADSKGSDAPSVEELERLEAEYHRVSVNSGGFDHLKPQARMQYMRAARARAKATGEPFRALEPVRTSSKSEGSVVTSERSTPDQQRTRVKDTDTDRRTPTELEKHAKSQGWEVAHTQDETEEVQISTLRKDGLIIHVEYGTDRYGESNRMVRARIGTATSDGMVGRPLTDTSAPADLDKWLENPESIASRTPQDHRRDKLAREVAKAKEVAPSSSDKLTDEQRKLIQKHFELGDKADEAKYNDDEDGYKELLAESRLALKEAGGEQALDKYAAERLQADTDAVAARRAAMTQEERDAEDLARLRFNLKGARNRNKYDRERVGSGDTNALRNALHSGREVKKLEDEIKAIEDRDKPKESAPEPAPESAPKPAEKADLPEPPKGRGAAGAPDEYRPERIENTGDVVLHHGGLPAGTTVDDIDVNRRGSQQGKRRRSFGGFYLTDGSSRQWSTTYAASRDGNMHAFKISPDARIGEINDEGGSSNIDRISEEQRENMAKHFDVIKGKDVLGRTQYLLLNKSVVTEVEETNVNEPDRAPVVTRVGKSDAPKTPKPEPAEPKKAATTQADRAKAIESAEAIQRAIANQFAAPRPERKPKVQAKADEAASASEAEHKLDKALEGRKDAAGNPIVNGARYRLGRGYQEWRVESVNRDGSLNLIPATGESPLGKARNRKNVASNRLLPVTDAVPTSAAPIAATQSTAVGADTSTLGELKDASGNALYTEGRYNLGRGYQRWQVDSVNPDGTVNLLPTGGGDTTRKRWNVDPKKLKPVEGEGTPAAPAAPKPTQQERRERIEARATETVKEAAPATPTPKVEAPAKTPEQPVTAVQPPKGMTSRVYRILIRTEENQLDGLQAKVTAGNATRDDLATIAALEKNLAKLRGEEALYFPETPSVPEPAPAPKPAPKAKRLTRKTEEWSDLDDETLDSLITALDEDGGDGAGFSTEDAANLRNERAVRDQQNADADRIIDLIAKGGDPAEAEAEVTGQSVETIRRRMALDWLRDTYGGVPAVSGNRFEEVLASAYQFELSEEIVRAEATTNGNFFSREAESRMSRRGQDASILWKGNERTARANASEELKAYWDAHGRLTKDEFRERVMDAIGRRAGGSRYTGADFHQ